MFTFYLKTTLLTLLKTNKPYYSWQKVKANSRPHEKANKKYMFSEGINLKLSNASRYFFSTQIFFSQVVKIFKKDFI